MPDSGEHELFEKAKTGNNAAFDRLQETLDASVRRFVRRLVGISEAEDDIVQDAFLALYMNLERLESSEHLRPFLFRVVRNRCYDTLRQQGTFSVCPSRRSSPKIRLSTSRSSPISANNPTRNCTGNYSTLRFRKRLTACLRFNARQ